MSESRILKESLEEFTIEHRRLDALIEKLSDENPAYKFEIQRLKKRRLWLRDQILYIQNKLLPDIIA